MSSAAYETYDGTEMSLTIAIIDAPPVSAPTPPNAPQPDLDDRAIVVHVVMVSAPVIEILVVARDTSRLDDRSAAETRAPDLATAIRPGPATADTVTAPAVTANSTPNALVLDAPRSNIVVAPLMLAVATPALVSLPAGVANATEPGKPGETDAAAVGVPGPTEVAIVAPASASSSAECAAAPWLAGIVTPIRALDAAEPLLAPLRQVVDQAEGLGHALVGKLGMLMTSPILAGAVVVAAAGALVRRRKRRTRAAIDVPEITAPRQLT
jgi:hypothetical protein